MSFDSGKILEETKKKKYDFDKLNKALEKDKIDYNKAIKGINNKTNAVKEALPEVDMDISKFLALTNLNEIVIRNQPPESRGKKTRRKKPKKPKSKKPKKPKTPKSKRRGRPRK